MVEDPSRRILFVTWTGLLINLVLSGFKFMAGVMGHSQAVVADSVHSLSDAVTDVAILLGARQWTAPADRDHPYGHGRIETVVTAFIGLCLGGVALRIGFDAVVTLQARHTEPMQSVALVAALVSIVCKEALYRWTVAEGMKLHSSAMVANAWHHRSDAFSSVPVAVAVAVTLVLPTWGFVDHVGAVVVSVFIIRMALKILRDAYRELTDAGVPEQATAMVRALAADNAEVREVHRVRARRIGAALHVDLHLLVSHDLSVLRAHAVSEEVRDRLLSSDLGIVDVVTHIEPYPQSSKGNVSASF